MSVYHVSDVAHAVQSHFQSHGVPCGPQLTTMIVDDLIASRVKDPVAITPREYERMLLDMEARPQATAEEFFKVCVFGGGAMGTAMACAMARMGHHVEILMLEQEMKHVESINSTHKNTMCFPNEILPDKITATTNPQNALKNVRLIFHAIPVQFSRKFLANLAPLIPPHVPIVSVSKGITLDTLDFMDDVIKQGLGRYEHPTAFVSGPSYAIGIVQAKPTMCVVAAQDIDVARDIQKLISSITFRTYSTSDVRGVEACSALKNVLSILGGMTVALGLGPNTTNALLTRGWADLRKLVLALGGRESTMLGLSGIGDLMLTCYGGLSRNAKFGSLLAEGKSVKEALVGAGGVVEGLPTAHATAKLAEKLRVRCPVLHAISVMLHGHLSASELVTYVMSLPLEDEFLRSKI